MHFIFEVIYDSRSKTLLIRGDGNINISTFYLNTLLKYKEIMRRIGKTFPIPILCLCELHLASLMAPMWLVLRSRIETLSTAKHQRTFPCHQLFFLFFCFLNPQQSHHLLHHSPLNWHSRCEGLISHTCQYT